MSKRDIIITAIKKQGVIPLFYHPSVEESKLIVQALFDAGLRVVEYTNRGGNALYNYQQLLETRNKQWPGLIIAAGTIRTENEAKEFADAGAELIISPGLVKGIRKRLADTDLLWIPGCMTPSEILTASGWGAKFIKIFPGSLLGPSYITAIREIFPDLEFMVTGGVDATKDDLSAWFRAGVSAVGLGSKLVSKERIEKKEYKKITSHAKELTDIINVIKTTPA